MANAVRSSWRCFSRSPLATIEVSEPLSTGKPAQEKVGYRIDYAAPSPDLAPYLGGFHGYHIWIGPGVEHDEIFLPSWGSIRFQTHGGDWSMRVGTRDHNPVPRAALFGPSSHAGVARVSTGHIIGCYLLPRGWMRLIGAPANKLADRIVPLGEAWGPEAGVVEAGLRDAPDIEAQKTIIEDALRTRLAATKAEPPEIAMIETMLRDPDITTVEQATDRLGWQDWQFARFVQRHFGFTPKLLMRRARFMRTILPLKDAHGVPWATMIDAAYSDQSHFIRDCHDFLAMTPSQFVARFQPIAAASFTERERVLGNQHHLLPEGDSPLR